MENLVAVEGLVVVLIGVATLVAIAVRRIRLPYTVSLVLVGLFLSIQRPVEINITPELILSIFVPPLVFEAAFHLDLKLLRSNLVPILLLAVPGVLLSTVLVGGIVSLGTELSLSVAIVFGALIAATDPVAEIPLFRTLGVPNRLAAAVEGESLFNDGTAIVVFQIALTTALTGTFDPLAGVFDFFRVSLGGIAVGLALGWLVAQLITRIDDRLIVTTLTTLIAYGSFLLAEQFHVSGVLAVVIAGLVTGNIGLANASPTTKITLLNLWDMVGFLANSLVFLLIGLDVELAQLWANLGPIAVAVIAVLFSRAVLVYSMPLIERLLLRSAHFPSPWRHVLFWGGLRGAISLALVLSIPTALPERGLLEAMTFGVMLFTLLVQGTTIQFLLDMLGLTRKPQHWIEREKRLGRLFATQAGLRHLERLHREGVLPENLWVGLREGYRQDQIQLRKEINHLFQEHAELEREMMLQARREALQAERSALADALRRNLISNHVYEELVNDIDHRLESLDLIEVST